MGRHQFVEGLRGELPDEISVALRCARLRAGLSRAALAETLHCGRWQVASLEGVDPKRRRPSAKMAEQLIDALALEDDPDGRVLAAEFRLLAAPASGRSKVGFWVRSREERARLAREKRAEQREAARERAAESCDTGSELGFD